MALFDSTADRVKIAALLMLGAVGILFWLGCAAEQAPVYTKDGNTYGTVEGAFRHRWWNYYERGLSYADGGYFQEALSDLNEALRRRDRDQRMARTYGMHFADYFPAREIGIIYYRQGRLEEARSFLKRSIEDYPTSKARFYLDRARRDLIQARGRPVPPPKLTVALAEEEIWTRDDPLVVSGTVEDDHYVSAVKIHGEPMLLEGAEKRVEFSRSLSLAEGDHTVLISAENLGGKRQQKRFAVHVDRSGPVVSMERVGRQEGKVDPAVSFSGSAYDPSQVVRIEGAAGPLQVQKAEEVFFSGTAPADAESVRLRVFDRLGNVTEAVISLLPGKKTAFRLRMPAPVLASRAHLLSSMLLAGFSGRGSAAPPQIRLKDWEETQTVYLDRIFLEGEVRDDTKVIALFVNEEPLLRRESPSVFFNCTVDLKEGNNRLRIDAIDDTGNSATAEIEVNREVPQAFQLSERLSMTVMPFEQKGEASPFSEGFQDQLIDALFEQDRFRLVERDRLDAVLQEQKLSRSELVDKDTAVKLGRLIAARAVLTGSIIQTRNGTEVVSRLVDTESAEILAVEDVYDEIQSLTDAARLAEGLAIKLHREFPLLTGYVIQPEDTAFYTDLGQNQVQTQRRLIVYREEQIKHPVSGKVLGAKSNILGRAVVTEVHPEMSKAEFLDPAAGPIRQLDRVITE